MTPPQEPHPIYRRDYQPTPYRPKQIDLDIRIRTDYAEVEARTTFTRREDHPAPLILNGIGMELLAVAINGTPLQPDDFAVTSSELAIHAPPPDFELTTTVRIDPFNNRALEGFYKSGDILCSQCEAEGFRRITYAYDRPDAMATFSTRLEADKALYPVLLSNGNQVAAGNLPDNRHFVCWQDPFPKPPYLFAVVAGDLALVPDSFETCSGRTVELRLYVDPGNEDRCAHALASLKRAMRWDEDVYGLEYDLDLFMIVAVDAFNFGAMENKGLNIFNSSCVLAKTKTATDADFDRIEAIVAHEYFHNWTGNRVTCRDWFQLTLKEGLTVFRDQEFSADMGSRTDKRIDDVRMLRQAQFPEDAGPNAHPIRPDTYIDINNFYTPTVYEKGAEVIRMIHTILGPHAFRAGIDLYFQRHDGQAVTCDDFVSAMANASGQDLEQFRRWYQFGGTPELRVTRESDPETGHLRLRCTQTCPRLPGYPEPEPLVIPLKIGYLTTSGTPVGNTETHLLTQEEQVIDAPAVEEQLIPSILQDFSAPIHVRTDLSAEERILLLHYDPNLFNRFEAGQQALLADLRELARPLGRTSNALQTAMRALLTLPDPMFAARALTLPSVDEITAQQEQFDPVLAWRCRETWCDQFATFAHDALVSTYHTLAEPAARPEREGAGARALRNTVLSYLMRVGEHQLAEEQFSQATCMTDQFGALLCLCRSTEPDARDQALDTFLNQWQTDPLVMNKWFSVQAGSPELASPEHIATLAAHPAFDPHNPNKLRSLYGAFARTPVRFHAEDGSGYRMLADAVIQIAAYNPSVAARLALGFRDYPRLLPAARAQMQEHLQRILISPALPPDVFEIVSKTAHVTSTKSRPSS